MTTIARALRIIAQEFTQEATRGCVILEQRDGRVVVINLDDYPLDVLRHMVHAAAHTLRPPVLIVLPESPLTQ